MDVRMSFQGRKQPVAPARQAEARAWDTNHDGYLSHREILKANEVDFRRKPRLGEDRPGLVHESKCWMAGVPNEHRAGYHSYAQVGRELARLEQRYPELCQRVSLGKSVEGREIWAVRLCASPEQRPAVVITGCHHAREWMTVEVPLGMATALCENPERLRDNEVWLVPLVNPDGYEYSRKHDNMWRKNRRVLESAEVGVDLNRNYWDGDPKTHHIYRPVGDTRRSTADDFEEGADDPQAENYRGPAGASEPETQAMVRLKLGRENVRGVLDFHSYGEFILHPPGVTKRVQGMAQLHRLAEKLNQAAGGGMHVMKGSDLYATSGGSDDLQWARGIPSFTFEVGGCFQPHPRQIPATVERMTRAGMAFIDEVSQGSTKPPAAGPED